MDIRWVRWGGFGGAVLLALSAFLGGAHADGDTASTPLSVLRGDFGPATLACWLVGTAGLCVAWWVARDRVPSTRWAVWTALLWAVPFLVVPPAGSRDVYSYACQGHLFLNGLSPYDYGVATLPCPWVEQVSPIWRDTPAPYGPLFVLAAAAAVLIGGELAQVVVILRLFTLAGLAAIAAGLPVLARSVGVPPQRALWVALAGPLVGLHLLGGPHNDALMIGAVVAAMAVLLAGPPGRARTVVAGLLLGAAVAIKITAIVVVPFAVLLAVPRPLVRATAVRAIALAGGVAAATMAAVTLVSGLGVGWLSGLTHTQDLVQFTSPPTAVGMTITYAGRLVVPGFDAVPVVRVLAVVLLAGLLLWLWLRALTAGDHVRASLRGAALASAAMIALAPSFHPWYVMFPLILLAAVSHRTPLVMATTIAAAVLVLPDGGGLARFVKFPGAPLMTLVIVALLIHYRPVTSRRETQPR